MANKSRKQKEVEDYLTRIKLHEIFQGLLHQVIREQPEHPFEYFHEEITKIKKEMEDTNIDIGSTTFLTTCFPPTEVPKPPHTEELTTAENDTTTD